jgi:HAE1 family hydrophobic/amphiphilic exporter-1
MNITELALRRPVTTVMLFVCFAAIGAISARLLPLEYFPSIEFPFVQVQVPYQGSTPEEVERLITKPIEEALATIGGIEDMRSDSDQNGASIGIFFGWEADPAVKGLEVLDKIDAIRGTLPSDVERVFVRKEGTGDQAMLRIRLSSNRDLSDAYDMLDRNIKRRLERIDGVSQVTLYGVEKREIRILLLADRIAAHNVDVQRLTQVLRDSNFSVTAGQISAEGSRLNVHPLGEFRSLGEIEELVIEGTLRLKDVARVTLGSPEREYGRHLDRRYAIGLDVFKETGQNMVEVTRKVLEELEVIKKLPQMEGISLFYMDNQAEGVTTSLADLGEAGLIGLAMSIAVLFFFLRQWSTTLIVALAVPASLSIAIAGMYFIGLSLNILSMMGLMLAVGMLVDNAVVVVENIHRKQLQSGISPYQAALDGTREVGLAITAGTLSTVIVFVPNIFGTQNEITIFLKHVAWAIVISLLASLFIALTMIPMLVARLPPPKPNPERTIIDSFADGYERLIDWTLRHRKATSAMIVVTLLSIAVPMGLVKKDMFPQEGSRKIYMDYGIEGRYSLEQVEAAVNTIEGYLYDHQEQWEIESVYSYYDRDRAFTMAMLIEDDRAERNADEIKEEMRKDMPKLAIGTPRFEFRRSGNSEGIKVYLRGDSSQDLVPLSREVARILGSTVEGLVDVRSAARGEQREVQIVVDRDRALLHGLSTQAVAANVAIALRGQNLRQFRGADGEIAVRLTYDADDSQTLEQLATLSLYAPSGERVQLSAIAELKVVRSPMGISREQRKTSVAIDAGLAKDVTMDKVRPKIEQVMDSIKLPAGYSWGFGRGVENDDETGNIMLTNMMLALMLIYLVMAALFESLLSPFVIIWTIFFSIIGVFWFFLASQTTFSFMAMIGILILMGVVVNNGVVMIDHINQLRAKGMPRDQALKQGARDRMRPILMTTASTLLAMVPLAIGDTQIGGDGPPYFPMARAMIGGLLFSTAASLIFLPTIFCWYEGLGGWWHKRLATARAVGVLKPAADPAGSD